ncbi:hypothetical protein ACFS07_23645 [Undibacterium arcticum]
MVPTISADKKIWPVFERRRAQTKWRIPPSRQGAPRKKINKEKNTDGIFPHCKLSFAILDLAVKFAFSRAPGKNKIQVKRTCCHGLNWTNTRETNTFSGQLLITFSLPVYCQRVQSSSEPISMSISISITHQENSMSNIQSAKKSVQLELDQAKQGRDYYQSRIDALEKKRSRN